MTTDNTTKNAAKPATPANEPEYQFAKPNKIAIVSAVSCLKDLAEDYVQLEELAHQPLPDNSPQVVDILQTGISIEQLAEDMANQQRARLGLGEGPVGDLALLLEQTTSLRIFRQRMPGRLAGIYFFARPWGGCIALNQAHPPERSIMTLAHEYGHFLTTRELVDVAMSDGGSWTKRQLERFADMFARHFLLPRNGVNRRLSDMLAGRGGKGPSLADILALAAHFGVSVEATFLRLEELGRLPAGKWNEVKARGFKAEQARQALGIVKRELPSSGLPLRYRLLAWAAYNNEQITEGQLARFLRTDRVGARIEVENLQQMCGKQYAPEVLAKMEAQQPQPG